jgi:hypothetical protein
LTLPSIPSGLDYLYIGVEAKSGEVLYNYELRQPNITHTVEFTSSSIPYKWVAIPHFPNESWGERKDIILGKTEDGEKLDASRVMSQSPPQIMAQSPPQIMAQSQPTIVSMSQSPQVMSSMVPVKESYAEPIPFMPRKSILISSANPFGKKF